MYLLVLVFTLPVFQPLKSNKKVGSSEDEIEGEFLLFVQSLQPIKQNADNVTGKGLACHSRGEQTITVEEMITF